MAKEILSYNIKNVKYIYVYPNKGEKVLKYLSDNKVICEKIENKD